MNHGAVRGAFSVANARMDQIEQQFAKLVLAKFSMSDDGVECTDKERKQADLTDKERFEKLSARVTVLNRQCLETLGKSEPKAAPALDAQVSHAALMAERAIKYQKEHPEVSLNDAHRAITGVGI